MRFAYADPPYPGGNAQRHYGYRYEVNHEILIGTLVRDYPDGWALSTHSNALRELLPMCPEDVRVAAWCKPFAAMRRTVVPMYSWEPVIFRTDRSRTWQKCGRSTLLTPHDWLIEMPPIFTGESRGVKGCKPIRFCWWILDLLGYQRGDTLEDLFPGSAIMAEGVASYAAQRDMFSGEPAEDGEQMELEAKAARS